MIIVYFSVFFTHDEWFRSLDIFMVSLHLLNEYFTNGYSTDLLVFTSIFSILCGISVIVSKNPVVSVLFLIGLFFGIAGYLVALGISFIGLSYLLVYVGAVSILFLFILMLINIRISELLNETSNSLPLAVIIGVCFSCFYYFYLVLPYSATGLKNSILTLSYMFKDNATIALAHVTGKIWDGNLAETSHITSIGNIMYTSYSIWLVITSIILLLAMVGSIVITIKQKN